MYIDKQNLLSEDQAITTTARSTNVINLGAAGIGPGEPIEVLCQVTTTFAGGTSIVAALMTDSDATISSGGVVLVQTAAIAAASLVAGYQFRLSTLGVGSTSVHRYQLHRIRHLHFGQDHRRLDP
jgi:hypothetical protein